MENKEPIPPIPGGPKVVYRDEGQKLTKGICANCQYCLKSNFICFCYPNRSQTNYITGYITYYSPNDDNIGGTTPYQSCYAHNNNGECQLYKKKTMFYWLKLLLGKRHD